MQTLLQTDANSVGVGNILEQRGHVIGRSFELLTDHAGGCLHKRWMAYSALAMQVFDFVIKYCKDCQNGNADALSGTFLTVVATQFLFDPIRWTQYCRSYMK